MLRCPAIKATILLSECAYHLRNLILHMCHTTRKLRGKPREGQEKVEEVPFISLIATQREIKPNKSKYLCQVEPLLQLVRRHFEQRLFEGSTGPTPAQHLLWLPSHDHHPYAISLYLSTRGPPFAGLRPLLLPCRCRCSSSRRSSQFCWPSRLRRGPVARAMASEKTQLHCNLQRHSWRRLNCHVTLGTNKNHKCSKGQIMLKAGKAKEGWTAAAWKWKTVDLLFSHN